MQEVVDATLLEKVKTSNERNKSLRMLDIHIRHDVIGTILKGANGSTSLLTKFLIWLLASEAPSRHKVRHNTTLLLLNFDNTDFDNSTTWTLVFICCKCGSYIGVCVCL